MTSCKKENYAEKFVGNYVATATPNLTISAPEAGSEAIEAETMEGLAFSISQVGDSQDVNLSFPIPEINWEDLEITEEDLAAMGIVIPEAFLLSGTCDETGLHLNAYNFDQTFSLPLEGINLDITLGLTLGGATIAEPVNNVISWNTPVNATISISMPEMPEEMVETTTLSGGIQFNATKQ
ncbi:MAG: hypothetical protein IJZ87_03015 [Bacteroidales bacterium]|nr:hypothetical protein [Bacteroidales bacterium]